jgi:hypothetical protein
MGFYKCFLILDFELNPWLFVKPKRKLSNADYFSEAFASCFTFIAKCSKDPHSSPQFFAPFVPFHTASVPFLGLVFKLLLHTLFLYPHGKMGDNICR